GAVNGSTGVFNLSLQASPPEKDPNELLRTATLLGPASQTRQLANFVISSPTDVDMFAFTAKARQQVTITVARPAGSGLIPVVRLFDGRGRQLAQSLGGGVAVLTFRFAAGGKYYIGVSGRG